eukprot:14542864-Alexandrium_andersonii.AAC.1
MEAREAVAAVVPRVAAPMARRRRRPRTTSGSRATSRGSLSLLRQSPSRPSAALGRPAVRLQAAARGLRAAARESPTLATRGRS